MKQYKYKGHTIIKTPMDLGEDDERLNYVYKIYKGNKYLNEALTLSTAKAYIDSDYDENYLWVFKRLLAILSKYNFIQLRIEEESENYNENNIKWWRCRLC